VVRHDLKAALLGGFFMRLHCFLASKSSFYSEKLDRNDSFLHILTIYLREGDRNEN